MTMFCNLGSLALGLLALLVPAVGILRRKYAGAGAAWSFLLCSLALTLQLVEAAYLNRTDVSGLMDTINAVAFCAVALTAAALILNLAALLRRKKQAPEK